MVLPNFYISLFLPYNDEKVTCNPYKGHQTCSVGYSTPIALGMRGWWLVGFLELLFAQGLFSYKGFQELLWK